MILNRVDLPQPDGPITDKNSPGVTVKETWSTAVIVPSGVANRLTTSSTTRNAGCVAGTTSAGRVVATAIGTPSAFETRHPGYRRGGVTGLDAHVDDGDLSPFHRFDRLRESDLEIADRGDRPVAPRTLRSSHAGEINLGIAHALADPLVLDRPLAREGDAFLVHLIVVERAIVGDGDEQGNAVVHRSPQCRDSHEEIAVAADGDGQAAGTLERERGTDGNARTAADAPAAVAADEVERMPKRPPAVVPRERQMNERRHALAHRFAQNSGEVLVAERARRHWDLGPDPRDCRLRVRTCAEGLEQIRHDGIRRRREKQIDRRQRLIVHAPAIVQAVVDRDLDDLGGGGGADGFECA